MSRTINISNETINIIISSLENSKKELKKQCMEYAKYNHMDKFSIAMYQLKHVEYVLEEFKELEY